MVIQDQFRGCLLGLALGDAMGAPFEGGFPERLVWKIIGKIAPILLMGLPRDGFLFNTR